MNCRIAKKVMMPGYVGRRRWSTVMKAFRRLRPRRRKWFAVKAWRVALKRTGGKWPGP